MIVQSHLLELSKPIPYQHQVYNGLDAALTVEIWEELQRLHNNPPEVYAFERALQGPALDIMLRGFLIDDYERRNGIELLKQQRSDVNKILQRFAFAIWDKGVNAQSGQQLQALFYKAMKIPEIWSSKKGVRALRMDRETLEKLEVYKYAAPIVSCVKAIRELDKKLDVLTADVDPDGRMRTSINVGATETGRLSSSTSTTGSGTNMFNITEELRQMFIADPGWKLCGIDGQQAESREIGFQCGVLFNDWSYLDACESGDLHTTSAKLIWPNLPWNGDPKHDRAIADQNFYRQFSYRDMSKRGGHGSNYIGSASTLAKHLKTPTKLIEDFQSNYFRAFPCIPRLHQWTAEQLQTSRNLTTTFGRKRTFFGRPGDDTTLREAVAYLGQSPTADRVNLAMLRIWRNFGNRIRLLLNLYDAVYFQFREDDSEKEIVEQALAMFDVPMWHGDRMFNVPGEAKTGWNWRSIVTQQDVAKAIAKGEKPPRINVDGLKKWTGVDTRKRTTGVEALL